MNAKHRILGYCTGVANFRQQIWVLRSHKSSMSSRLSLKPRRVSGRAKATFTPQFFTTYTQRLGTIQKTMRTVSVNFPEKLLASQLLHPHCPNPQLWSEGFGGYFWIFLAQDDSVVDRKFSLRIDARTTKSLKKWKSARAGWRMVHGQMAHGLCLVSIWQICPTVELVYQHLQQLHPQQWILIEFWLPDAFPLQCPYTWIPLLSWIPEGGPEFEAGSFQHARCALSAKAR